VNAYSPLLDTCASLANWESTCLHDARRYIVMYDAIKDFLQTNNSDFTSLMSVYDEELDNRFNDFSVEEHSRIDILKNFSKLERALVAKAHRLALVTARDIEMQTRTPLTDTRLSVARKHFIKEFEAKNLHIYLQNGRVLARWDWPDDDLVQLAVLAWRGDRWP